MLSIFKRKTEYITWDEYKQIINDLDNEYFRQHIRKSEAKQ